MHEERFEYLDFFLNICLIIFNMTHRTKFLTIMLCITSGEIMKMELYEGSYGNKLDMYDTVWNQSNIYRLSNTNLLNK